MVTNRYHHQYSLRRARPEKVAYLLSRTLLTAWLKDMTRSWSGVTASGADGSDGAAGVGDVPATRHPAWRGGNPRSRSRSS